MKSALILSFQLLACSEPDLMVDSTQPFARNDSVYEYSSPHVTFVYTNIDRKSIAAIAQYVEAHRAKIVADLQPESLKTICIYLHATLKDVLAALGWPDAPNWVKGAATGPSEVHMISPNSADLGSSATYDFMLTCIIHEFVHCVTMHVNTSIANKPRWLWESVALYESGQFVDPLSLTYLRNGLPPSLDLLNDINDTKIYEVGYTIAEFVVSKWGMGALRELIVSNGDTQDVLNISESDFPRDWYAYVMNKYYR